MSSVCTENSKQEEDRDDITPREDLDIGFIDQHGPSEFLDGSLYEVDRNDNEPADSSSPVKSGGFQPVFFNDRKLISPIEKLPAAAVCSKGEKDFVVCIIIA